MASGLLIINYVPRFCVKVDVSQDCCLFSAEAYFYVWISARFPVGRKYA